MFIANIGPDEAYIGANFDSTASSEISNWLITPILNFQNGDVFSFYTTTAAGSLYPDHLEVSMSTNGTSSNVGTLPTDVGDFTTVIHDINHTEVAGGYPEVWTQYSFTVTGMPALSSGRIAFRYVVSDAGPARNNSNYIGIDDVEYRPIPTMIFGGIVMLSLSLLTIGTICIGQYDRQLKFA